MKPLETALRRMWRGDPGAGPLLLAILAAPPAALFGTVVRARNLLYDQGILAATRAPVPVISIGNLAVGGTGKTPVAAWMVRQLLDQGRRPALVTRGYGDDEIALHRRWNPKAPVIRAPRRIEGARRAAADDRDVVVLDDGFQHRGMARDLDVVLLSPVHHLPPRLLPRGPFRERLGALRRADHVLVTMKGKHEREAAERLADALEKLPGAPAVDLFPFRVGPWETLDGARGAPPEGSPLVVTSVAEPDGFVQLVRASVGEAVDHLAFPDHHPFDEADASRISGQAAGRWIAVTEKDAVKLMALAERLPPCRVLGLTPEPDRGLASRLLRRMETNHLARSSA